MNNVSYIYKPHFNSNCFRVACKDQPVNSICYIVVTCSPEYNGVYRYTNKGYKIWMNGHLPCYQVPIGDCVKIKDLKDLFNKEVIKKVKNQQKKWFIGQVTNKDAYKTNKPEWML